MYPHSTVSGSEDRLAGYTALPLDSNPYRRSYGLPRRGAAGALLGGTLSDRIGRRAMLALGTLLGAPLLMLALSLPPGAAMLVVLALAGVALLSGGPVQLVLMQELLPDNRGAAVGLSIFMVTVASAVGTITVGALGQLIGLQAALILAAAVALLALPFVALLPETRHVSGRLP